MCHFAAYIYLSHILHEFFSQSNLSSQDLSFIGYTFKNFEAIKGLHQSLGKWFCFILEIIQLFYFNFITFQPVEMFGFLRRMFKPCKTFDIFSFILFLQKKTYSWFLFIFLCRCPKEYINWQFVYCFFPQLYSHLIATTRLLFPQLYMKSPSAWFNLLKL